MLYFVLTNLLTIHFTINMRLSSTQPLSKPTEKYFRIQKEFKSFVAKKFAEFEIVPDLIVTAPDELCNVTFPQNVVVKIGEKLSSEQIKEEPEVLWNCDQSSLYTLIMQNVDDHDCLRSRSWVVINCKGCNYFEGHNIFDYKEQDPDIKKDQYRIVFLIYRQPKRIRKADVSYDDFTNEFISPDPSFDTQHFVDRHGLGDPVAGNFFIVDDLKPKNRMKNVYVKKDELLYPKLLFAWEKKVKMEALQKAMQQNSTK